MSASREKKARQEFNASGAVDPKAAREAQERAKQRRSNWLYGGIAIVFVLVAAALLVWNSNVIQRGSAAVTVEGETYSAAEVSYFYHVAYNSIAQNQYASYYGLSTSTPLTQQSLSDMAKTLLGVSEDMTWDAYFKDAAKKSLIQITMLKKGAAEKGITWNDDMQKELDSTMDTLASYAKSAGKSEGEYLKQLYGSNMTKKIFQGILKDTIIASHYQQDYIDSLQYTDEEIQKYYEENKNSFDVANYEMIPSTAQPPPPRTPTATPSSPPRRRAPLPCRRPRTPPTRPWSRSRAASSWPRRPRTMSPSAPIPTPKPAPTAAMPPPSGCLTRAARRAIPRSWKTAPPSICWCSTAGPATITTPWTCATFCSRWTPPAWTARPTITRPSWRS